MSLDSPDNFYNIENPDREEMIENSRNTVAMKLFRKIMEDFSHHDFTLRDIVDSYNDQVSKNNFGQRYGKSHLDYLVGKDLLDFDEETGEYSINHTSPDVARIMEEEE